MPFRPRKKGATIRGQRTTSATVQKSDPTDPSRRLHPQQHIFFHYGILIDYHYVCSEPFYFLAPLRIHTVGILAPTDPLLIVSPYHLISTHDSHLQPHRSPHLHHQRNVVPGMLSYILAAVVAFIGINAVLRSGSPSQQTRAPRPHLNESLLAIDHANATAPECPPDAYVARVLSREPLVLYLENFLSESERQQLLEIRYAASSDTHPD